MIVTEWDYLLGNSEDHLAEGPFAERLVEVVQVLNSRRMNQVVLD